MYNAFRLLIRTENVIIIFSFVNQNVCVCVYVWFGVPDENIIKSVQITRHICLCANKTVMGAKLTRQPSYSIYAHFSLRVKPWETTLKCFDVYLMFIVSSLSCTHSVRGASKVDIDYPGSNVQCLFEHHPSSYLYWQMAYKLFAHTHTRTNAYYVYIDTDDRA